MAHHIKTVSVFCGSATPASQTFIEETKILAQGLAAGNIRSIFGGYDGGLMGTFAHEFKKHRGTLWSIYPKNLSARRRFVGAERDIVTKSAKGQRGAMRSLSDAFIILPGSLNTLAEMFDQISANDMDALIAPNRPLKPIIICNPTRYYDAFAELIERSVADSFTKETQKRMLHIAPSAKAALEVLHTLNEGPQQKAGILRP